MPYPQVLRLMVSILGPVLLGLLTMDLLVCARHNGELSSAARAAAFGGLHELTRQNSSEERVAAEARRVAQANLKDLQPVQISVHLAEDRRTVNRCFRAAGTRARMTALVKREDDRVCRCRVVHNLDQAPVAEIHCAGITGVDGSLVWHQESSVLV